MFNKSIWRLFTVAAISAVFALGAVACGSDEEAVEDKKLTAAEVTADYTKTQAPSRESPPRRDEEKEAPKPAPEASKAAPTAAGDCIGCIKSPDANPIRGGTIKTAWGATTKHFDIHQGGAAHIMTSFYNKLIGLNLADGLRTISPELAVGWEIAPDQMSFSFDLREGVTFHDGSDFNADDVTATFNRIIFPPEGVTSTAQTLFSAIGGIEKVDDYTVKFTLSEPRVWQFDLFTNTAAVVYPDTVLAANNNDLRTSVSAGTGPFKFVENKPGEVWEFEANANYWNPELPYVDKVMMPHVPAWTDRGTAVLTQQADFSWNVSRDTWDEGNSRDDISAALLANFGALEVKGNNGKDPWTDNRVRRAMHLAVNRHDAIEVYREETNNLSRWMSPGGEGATADDVVRTIPGYKQDNAADVAEAQKLMADAGFADGEGLRTFKLVSASVPGHAEVLAPFYADQMKRNLGMKIEISAVERSLVPEEFKKDYDMVLSTSYHSPIKNHTPLWTIMWTTGASQNFGKYSNPDFDAVVKKLNAEGDPAKRKGLFSEGEDILDASPPQFHFGFTSHMPMWRNYVKGLVLETRVQAEWGRFETVWMEPH